MGLWDNVKNFVGIDAGEFEDDEVRNEAAEEEYYDSSKKREPKIFQPERKSKTMVPPQMQVVIVKPD